MKATCWNEQTEHDIAKRLAPGHAYNMAISNDCLPDWHPQKITRSDIELVRAIASDSGSWTDANREALARLAAKLAALLPPDA